MAFLDLGCGEGLQAGFIGVDKRFFEKYSWDEFVHHDLEQFPWPFEDNKFKLVLCSHLLEHIKPWLFFDFMNEIWRISAPDSQIFIASPYAGSVGGYQDPSHVRSGFIEASFYYLDPRTPLWNVYKPKPFFIEHTSVDILTNISVRLRTIKQNSKEITPEKLKDYGIY